MKMTMDAGWGGLKLQAHKIQDPEKFQNSRFNRNGRFGDWTNAQGGRTLLRLVLRTQSRSGKCAVWMRKVRGMVVKEV